jgi:hypothetical protein
MRLNAENFFMLPVFLNFVYLLYYATCEFEDSTRNYAHYFLDWVVFDLIVHVVMVGFIVYFDVRCKCAVCVVVR